MPYPFFPLPTFAEFRKIVEEKFDCEYKSLPIDVGEESPEIFHYLERKVNGEMIQCVIFLKDDEVMLPSVIRSTCARLGIDPRDLGIGLDLG